MTTEQEASSPFLFDPTVVSASRRCARGLIFGLIRLRLSTFISIRINAAIQATDVNGMGELLSRALKIGKSSVQPLPDDHLALPAHA